MTTYNTQEIETALGNLTGDWQVVDEVAIQHVFSFASFMDAIEFVTRVAGKAEEADHHPDILIQYNKVTITLSTHSEGGLTEKDFALAREIEAL